MKYGRKSLDFHVLGFVIPEKHDLSEEKIRPSRALPMPLPLNATFMTKIYYLLVSYAI
jgi:hypothetical protein